MADRLAALPPYDGLVFCGSPAGTRPPAEGGELVVRDPLPASPDPRRATDNFSTAGLWVVRTSDGRSVAAHRPAPEVVLLPGATLTVLVRSRFGELPVTVLVAGGTTGDARQVATDAANRIRRALADPALTDLEHGRYVTDLRTSDATWHAAELEPGEPRTPAAGDGVEIRYVDGSDWVDGTVAGRRATGGRDDLVVDLVEGGTVLVTRADGRSWDTPPEPEVPTRVTDESGSPHRRAWLRPRPA